jgi:hypothetical protein
MLNVNTPAPPTPLNTRPRMKTPKLLARLETSAPNAKKSDETRIMMPGEKIMANLPTSGAMDAMVMRYADVNHIASAYESRSAAMVDWVIVMPDMLDAFVSVSQEVSLYGIGVNGPCRKIRAHMLRMIQTARFHPITGSSSDAVAGSVSGEPSLRVAVSDWISGVFSVAVAAVKKSSPSGW